MDCIWFLFLYLLVEKKKVVSRGIGILLKYMCIYVLYSYI